mgnify:CR=1 FL=1
MKIVTWNCNLNLERKFDLLQSLTPDIAIIQECEKLPEGYFPNRKFFWTGRIESKGLGILIKDSSARLQSDFNPNLINFLPIETDSLKILGIWAYNHRAVKFGDDVSGNTIDAINHYRQWLQEDSHPCLVGGDFNNSVIWDKPNNNNNFQNINRNLESLGYTSAYHYDTKDGFGQEDNPTFFHTKNRKKTYHIDYIYLKGLEAIQVDVGAYDEWIKLSDHVPVIANLGL